LPCAIRVDLMTPGMNGIEFISPLHADPAGGQVIQPARLVAAIN
jgi:CheY-like chemotaxis protein